MQNWKILNMILKTWRCFKAYKAFDLSHLCSPPALQREKLRNVNYVKYSVKSFEMSKSCAYTHRHFHLLKTPSLLPQSIWVLGGCMSSWGRVGRRGSITRTQCSSSPIPCGLLLLFFLLCAFHRDPNTTSSFKSPLGCGDSKNNPQRALGSAFLRLPWLF